MSLTVTKGPSIAPRAVLAPSPAGSGAASSPELAGSPGMVTSIVTSREWVLPPRPKPGRKPSADTPASKRKAQNRAAQRAFRERRATRVQELEQKLLEVEKEKDLKEMTLVNTINKLKFENQFLIKSMNQLRLEFSSLKSSVSSTGQSPNSINLIPQQSLLAAPSPSGPSSIYKPESRNADADVAQTAQSLLNFAKSSPAAQPVGTPNSQLLVYSVQQVLPAPSTDSPRNSVARGKDFTGVAKTLSLNISTKEAQDFDCGICIKDSCLCQDAGLKTAPPSVEETFKLFKPMAAVSLKRKAPSKEKEKEKDFTSMFSRKKIPDLKRLRSSKATDSHTVKKENAGEITFNEESPMENCGFCSDDTPCVCREAAKEAARLSQSLSDKFFDGAADEDDRNDIDDDHPTALPPLQLNSANIVRTASLPVLHPGPTLELREFSNAMASNGTPAPTETEEKEKLGCTGNPGTCSQCQLDPMSTLFCTTVASKAAMENEDASRSKSPTNKEASPTPTSSAQTQPLKVSGGTEIFIPCADAYKTLSRHKRFNTVDFSSLVGRLTTRGMQVEVQSVANIIRELDRKVYD